MLTSIQLHSIGIALAIVVASPSFAQSATSQEELATARVMQGLKETYRGTRFTSVRQSEVAGIYEVVMGSRVAYTDASGRYFLFGRLVDMQTQEDLTAERSSELQKAEVGTFPLDQAIKTVRGRGERVLYVFEDPECGYCKVLHQTLAKMDNVTIYTFLTPILGPRSMASAKAIWCSEDRSRALTSYMLDKTPMQERACETPLQKNLALSEQLGVRGTPTMFTSLGRRLTGAMSMDQLNAALNTRGETVAKGGK